MCLQIKSMMTHSSRLQLLHFLFGIAAADNHVHPKEVEVIKTIAYYLGSSNLDFDSKLCLCLKLILRINFRNRF